MKNDTFASLAIGWTTTATLVEAYALAELLVDQKLVACAQISPAITSLFCWEGKLQKDEEFRLTLKFPTTHADAILTALREHHPYQTPQWLWVKADGCSPEYLNWALGVEG